jgi:hypothetical protein
LNYIDKLGLREREVGGGEKCDNKIGELTLLLLLMLEQRRQKQWKTRSLRDE